MPSFDAKLYEHRALWYVARRYGRAVRANVRLRRLDVPWSRRPEVDGVLDEGGDERAVEVKSYPLDRKDLDEIVAKYEPLGFKTLTIVAPSFGVDRLPARIDVELVAYTPDTASLRAHYRGAWDEAARRGTWRAPASVEAWLARGGVHFRYSTAEVSPGAPRMRRTINQIDKGIRTTALLARELATRIAPSRTPIKVHWSPCRLLFPKDLYFRARTQRVLESPLAFDIDGGLVHHASAPCSLDPATGLCADCTAYARQHARRLVAFLRERGHEPDVVFSGRAGFHVYALGARASLDERRALVREIAARRIAIDRPLASSKIPIIAFPGSVNGISLRPLVPVPDLERFSPADAPPIGDP